MEIKLLEEESKKILNQRVKNLRTDWSGLLWDTETPDRPSMNITHIDNFGRVMVEFSEEMNFFYLDFDFFN